SMGVPEATHEAPANDTSVGQEFGTPCAATALPEARLRYVVDSAPIYLAQFDRDGRFTFVNDGYARRFGLLPAQIVGQLVQGVIGAAAYEVVRGHVEAALAGRAVEFEAAIPYPRLGVRVMHCGYRPEVDAAGEVRGVVEVLLDVTDRVHAEAARHER